MMCMHSAERNLLQYESHFLTDRVATDQSLTLSLKLTCSAGAFTAPLNVHTSVNKPLTAVEQLQAYLYFICVPTLRPAWFYFLLSTNHLFLHPVLPETRV